MAPAIRTGDLIIVRSTRPAQVYIGDIVTFADATRGDVLITHRVADVQRTGESFAFATKGDANTSVERWEIDADTNLLRFAVRVPKLGFVVAYAGSRAGLGLVSLFLIALGLKSVLRRIWA
jgi:signal peptidase